MTVDIKLLRDLTTARAAAVSAKRAALESGDRCDGVKLDQDISVSTLALAIVVVDVLADLLLVFEAACAFRDFEGTVANGSLVDPQGALFAAVDAARRSP